MRGRRLSGFDQAEREALYAATIPTRPFGPAEAVRTASQGAPAGLGGLANLTTQPPQDPARLSREAEPAAPADTSGADPSPRDHGVARWERPTLVRLFGADLRSLAAFRIALAVLVLADLASRATDLSAHYSDQGVLPRTVLLEDLLSRWSVSLNLISGEPFIQAILFGVAAVAALGMLLGYHTRLMTVAVWVLLLSIQWRNPLVLNLGDVLLRLLLFWAMFLPLGARWSLDRSRRAAREQPATHAYSFATIALFAQIAFVYWFSVLLKSGPEWRTEGSAVYYALSIDQIATPFGSFLLGFPALLTVLTFATLALEAIGPFLLFCPVWTERVRIVAVGAFISFQLGIWLTMDIGLFPWTGALCMVCFLPGRFWDVLVPRLLEVVRRRPRAARTDRVALPPSTARSSPGTNLLAIACLGYVLAWNVMTVSSFRLPQSLLPPGSLFGLAQRWDMFAPYPAKDDGWYVIPGTLRGGAQTDLMAVTRGDFRVGEGVSFAKPGDVAGIYPNEHWRSYFLKAIRAPGSAVPFLYLGRYLCREWNARHNGVERLSELQIVYMREETLPDDRVSAPFKVVMWRHSCLGGGPSQGADPVAEPGEPGSPGPSRLPVPGAAALR